MSLQNRIKEKREWSSDITSGYKSIFLHLVPESNYRKSDELESILRDRPPTKTISNDSMTDFGLTDESGIELYMRNIGILQSHNKTKEDDELMKDYLAELTSFVQYRNDNGGRGLKRIIREYNADWITTADDARVFLKAAMNEGFFLKRYDGSVAELRMKEDMVREYCLNTKKSLKEIAKNLSMKYMMNVSGSTIRNYARTVLADNKLNRKDRSAKQKFENINAKYPNQIVNPRLCDSWENNVNSIPKVSKMSNKHRLMEFVKKAWDDRDFSFRTIINPLYLAIGATRDFYDIIHNIKNSIEIKKEIKRVENTIMMYSMGKA